MVGRLSLFDKIAGIDYVGDTLAFGDLSVNLGTPENRTDFNPGLLMRLALKEYEDNAILQAALSGETPLPEALEKFRQEYNDAHNLPITSTRDKRDAVERTDRELTDLLGCDGIPTVGFTEKGRNYIESGDLSTALFRDLFMQRAEYLEEVLSSYSAEI